MSALDRLPAEIARKRVLPSVTAAEFCGQTIENWRKLRQKGKLPAPIRLGGKKLGWRIGDLIDWLDRQASA
ncbi:hypothetical protein [Bosea sp. (in: a-proteobacteria)]|uniref:helix-turn-helix transcriptional regulator n=1 Tax=Bosea sp. (in: a-proteobacteria) TaxID=1871050 RepID=UPI001ACE19D9|nr:hypothetical protein [Bosea sp. (in: a-proteobacteria)]MBN9438235.1 hypothetical protein [Bosea sp. (in: a-proteobacteria)]